MRYHVGAARRKHRSGGRRWRRHCPEPACPWARPEGGRTPTTASPWFDRLTTRLVDQWDGSALDSQVVTAALRLQHGRLRSASNQRLSWPWTDTLLGLGANPVSVQAEREHTPPHCDILGPTIKT